MGDSHFLEEVIKNDILVAKIYALCYHIKYGVLGAEESIHRKEQTGKNNRGDVRYL